MLGAVATAAAALADPEVRGLDVPVVHPNAVEHDQRLEQIRPPALEQVEGQPGSRAQHVAQGLLAGRLEHQRPPVAHLHRAVDEPHHPRVRDPSEDLGLGGEPRRGHVVDRHLQDAPGIGAGTDREVADQQPDRGRAGAQPTFDLPPVGDHVARQRLQRVGDVLGGAGGALGLRQPVEEGGDVGQPVADRRPGGFPHEVAQGGGHLRQVGGQIQPAIPLQPLPRLARSGAGGRPASTK